MKVLLRHSLLIIVLLSISFPGAAQKVGIQFFEGTFQEALEEAKSAGKPLFVDAYTSWCGPCKLMASKVFTNEDVGDFYNHNFVNFKIDVEKAKDGPSFAQQYKIRSYPTMLFIGSDGSVIHKIVGARRALPFIEEGKKGLYDESQLDKLAEQYEGGDRDPAFMRKYINLLHVSGGPAYQRISSEYFKSLTEETLKEKENLRLIFNQADRLTAKPFKMILENKALFMEEFGEDKVANKIMVTSLRTVKDAINDRDEELFQEVLSTLEANAGEDADIDIYLVKLEYFQGIEKWVEYQQIATEFLNEYEVEDARLLNTIAWNFYKNVEDEEGLALAEEWAKTSVRVKSAYHNNDTYASLLYKNGKKAEAIEVAEKAIAIAKMEGKDPKSSQRLLDKIFAD